MPLDSPFLRLDLLSIYRECGTRSDLRSKRPCQACRGYIAGVGVVTILCRAWRPLESYSDTDLACASLFLNLYSRYRVLDIACLERHGVGVYSQCTLPSWMQHVIPSDWSPWMATIVIDLGFSWFMVFCMLFVLHLKAWLVDYVHAIAFEGGRVQPVSVSAGRIPSCTSSSVATRTLWSLCYFFCISSIDTNVWIPFVWGEPVSKSIVGVDCCCEWNMSFVSARPAQSVVFCIDLQFFWLLTFWILYVIYRIDPLVESGQALACKHGTVQLVWVLVHLRPLICCIWWSRGYFDRFVIFFGFKVCI